MGTRCRVSLAVVLCRGTLPVWSAPSPAAPLRKQEGASHLLNLCIDKLSSSAEEDCPELICLFKLLVVIVTSPLTSSTHRGDDCPRAPGFVTSGTFLLGSWRPRPFVGETWRWREPTSADLAVCAAPFLVVGARPACSFRGP